MKLSVLLLLALGGASLSSAQTIAELGPAASYIPTGLPGGGIAQGSYFFIKGTNLGPSTGVLFSGPAAYTMGVDLAGTRVRVAVGSSTVDAFPYYTSAAQVNVLLPSTTPIGSGTVTVFYNGGQATFPITVVRAAYGIFTLNSAGSGPAVVTDVNYGVVTFTNALHPGDRGTLWGTGLGAVNFPDNQPTPGITRLEGGVTMLIGGKAATIEYAGRTPGLSGLDQINFIVPQGVSGCGVPLVVRIAGVASNFTTIPVAASGTTCSDPGGLSISDLSAAQAGSLSIGAISLNRSTLTMSADGQSLTSKTDVATGSFSKFDFNSLIRSNSANGASVGNCIVNTFKGSGYAGDPVITTLLNAGAKLTLNGPNGSKDMPNNNGIYSVSATSQSIPGLPGGIPGLPGAGGAFLDPGSFTITGPGGTTVGSFSASITVPTALVWTNQAAITSVPRNQDLLVTWTGGGASDQAIISGAASDSTSGVGAVFICYANASAGNFSVPSFVLSALPVSSVTQGSPTGILQVGSYGVGQRFNATGINYGVVSYSVTNMSNVNYQ